MQKVLVVIDMQNDFVDGALGSSQAQLIVDNVRKKIESFDGPIIFTRDRLLGTPRRKAFTSASLR